MCLVKNSILLFLFKLYPFGLAYNDTSLPSSDDGHSSLIRLSEDFVFYNKKSRIVYVSMYVCIYVSMYMHNKCLSGIHMYAFTYMYINVFTYVHTIIHLYMQTHACIDVLYVCFYEQMISHTVALYIKSPIGGGSCRQLGGLTQTKLNYACKYSNNGHTL